MVFSPLIGGARGGLNDKFPNQTFSKSPKYHRDPTEPPLPGEEAVCTKITVVLIPKSGLFPVTSRIMFPHFYHRNPDNILKISIDIFEEKDSRPQN